MLRSYPCCITNHQLKFPREQIRTHYVLSYKCIFDGYEKIEKKYFLLNKDNINFYINFRICNSYISQYDWIIFSHLYLI